MNELNLFEVEQALTIREKLDALEAELFKHPQIEIPPRHYFAKGLYAREITIPAGTLLTGKIHTTQHINIISKGEISVLTEHGPRRVKAPCTLVSPPGTKRAGYAHEETVWTTIHANPADEHDVDILEAMLIAPTYAAAGILEAHGQKEEAVCPLSP